MIKLVGTILLFLFCSCGISRTICQDNALYYAQHYEDKGYEVRVVFGRLPQGYHVQAQARIEGEWRQLESVHYGEEFVHIRHLTIRQAKERWSKQEKLRQREKEK